MGREWNWTRSSRRVNTGDKQRNHAANSAGCMGMSMLHVFDLHRMLFFSSAASRSSGAPAGRYDDPSPFREEEHSPPSNKGLEAPRNSLEMMEPPSTTSPYDHILEIPSGIRVVPWRRREVVEEARSSEGSNSARTGNLVARLMGLDHLPDRGASFTPRSTRTDYYINQQHHQEATNQILISPPPAATQHDNGKKGYLRKLVHKGGSTSSSSSKSTTINGHSSGSRTPPPRHPLQPRNGNIIAEGRHGTRSLPETPRASLQARRSWDSDPRLSSSSSRHNNNNNNKENILLTPSAILELKSICTDHSALLYSPPLSETGGSAAKSKGKEYNAREIVRLVKDSVSRRIAGSRDGGGRSATAATTTIINTDSTTTDHSPIRSMRKVRSSFDRVQQQQRSEESPSPSTLSTTQVEHRRSSKSSSNPDRDPPRKQEADWPRPISTPTVAPRAFISSNETLLSAPSKAQQSVNQQHVSDNRCKKASLDRFMERLKKPPPNAAPPRRNALISLPLGGRATAGSSPAPIVAAKRSRSYRDGSNDRDTTVPEEKGRARQPSGCAWSSSPPAGQEAEVNHYVKSVLRKSGFYASNPRAVQWHSPSHPLDPVLFHQLELLVCYSSTTSHYYRGALHRRCNRKLLYDLVDEVLAETIWPFLAARLRRRRPHTQVPSDGDALLRLLLMQIRAYPSADCKVMEDIDALVELDLPDANVRRLLRHPALAEEADAVVTEVEEALLDSLLEDSVWHL